MFKPVQPKTVREEKKDNSDNGREKLKGRVEKGKIILSQKILQRKKTDKRIRHYKGQQKLDGFVIDRDRILDKVTCYPRDIADGIAFYRPESRYCSDQDYGSLNQRAANDTQNEKQDFGKGKSDAQLEKAKAHQNQ